MDKAGLPYKDVAATTNNPASHKTPMPHLRKLSAEQSKKIMISPSHSNCKKRKKIVNDAKRNRETATTHLHSHLVIEEIQSYLHAETTTLQDTDLQANLLLRPCTKKLFKLPSTIRQRGIQPILLHRYRDRGVVRTSRLLVLHRPVVVAVIILVTCLLEVGWVGEEAVGDTRRDSRVRGNSRVRIGISALLCRIRRRFHSSCGGRLGSVGGGKRAGLRRSRWETMGRSRWSRWSRKRRRKRRSKVRTVFVAMIC
jgi:hypothetical protein